MSFNGYAKKYEDINASQIVGGKLTGSVVNSVPAGHVGIGDNTTLTAEQVLVGYASIDGAAADVLTFPSAAEMVAKMGAGRKVAVGDTVFFTVNNQGANASGTSVAGTGGTLVGLGVVPAGGSKVFAIRLTNVTASSEAYDLIA